MTRLSRVLLALASVCVLGAAAMPLWNIRLHAPQYPEGLGMVIHSGTVRGATDHDLANINELNHYIGMRSIEPDEIPELRIIPWLMVGLGALGLGVAAVGRRAGAWVWMGAFAALGAVGLWDFWHWEYTYGHDLDLAHAIIKVPGMTYQPPLIGTKQLLNFTASSWPAVGAMVLGAAFLMGAAAIVLDRGRHPERAPAARRAAPRQAVA